METKYTFSFQRLVLLTKHSLIINKKLIGITLTAMIGMMVLVLIFFQSMESFKTWQNRYYETIFAFFFFAWGIIYSSLSFPAFRSKEKSMAYLMLPASSSEKFVFELLSRIVIYILFMPLLFWTVANFEGTIVHQFVPKLTNYRFSFTDPGFSNGTPIENEGWLAFAFVQGGLFVFIAAFTGASHFSKSPLLKTLFAITMIVAGYFIFIYLTFKGLSLNEFDPVKNHIHFIANKNNALIAFAIAATILNLCLITIAFFRLKEKEA